MFWGEIGRPGPEIAWQRFDGAVKALNRATSQTDLHRVGSDYEEIAAAPGALAGEIDYEDRARGLLPESHVRGSA